jgi:hypothetical protein
VVLAIGRFLYGYRDAGVSKMNKSRGFIIKCDTCPAVSHEINTDNKIVAQRVLTTFFHWKVYQSVEKPLPEGQLYEWKRACPDCVRKYAIAKAKGTAK